MNVRKVEEEECAATTQKENEQTVGPKKQGIPHKGTVPFRRVGSAVHTFVQVAVPADLDRLSRHKSNIKKWRRIHDHQKVRAEYINSARTVKQLTRNLQEIELLRTKIVETDLQEFDRRLNPAKDQVEEEIRDFLEIHGEAPDDNGKIEQSQKTNNDKNALDDVTASWSVTDSLERTQPSICGDCNKYRPPCENTSTEMTTQDSYTGTVHMRGNRLVMEPSHFTANSEIRHGDMQDEEQARSENRYGLSSTVPELCEETEDICLKEQQSLQLQQLDEDNNEWEKLRKDLTELYTTICDFSALVHHQGEVVDDITANIEEAEVNIRNGTSQLEKATMLKAAMFPVLGAVVGGIVGGPIGFAAGLKLGSVTGGLAAAGVTGSIIGYQGGKILKEKQQNGIEMKPLNPEMIENTSDSCE